jgi:alanine racemase
MELNADALRANYREVARRAGSSVKVMPSLKGDAYGFGAVETARICEDMGAYALFTGSIREAAAMRAAGVRLPIVMFADYLPEAVSELLAHDLTPTICNSEFADAVEAAASGPIGVYVKVDAGLGRLGVPLADAAEFVSGVARRRNLKVAGVYTHLPFASTEGAAWARRRLADFDGLLDALRLAGHDVPISQSRASSCVAAGFTDKANAVCVGHLLYGLTPFSDEAAGDMSGLCPVLSKISARLIHVGRHSQGEDLAIGGLYGLRRGKTVGVLPVGLAHGLGALRAGATATLGGKPAPLISISLEHTTIDLDEIEDPRVGDEVVLVDSAGEGQALADFAAAQGRSPLEQMTAMSARWPRRYVDPVKDVWDAFNR